MTLPSGSRLGPYEIESALGAGGMGEVYRARDTRLDRTVAVKVLPADLAADEERRKRLEREARAISQLSHPHICALYDVGRHADRDFLVMEYLEGDTLAERLERGSLPIDEAFDRGVEIARALEAAHRRGIVHRDLKPGNVMLTGTGVKLLDFGLAKAALEAPEGGDLTAMPTRTTPLTTEGAILGTLQYMAPEQLEGREADARSDMFSFGCVLYEMVTGRAAFQAVSQASLIAAILKEEPANVADLLPAAPDALDRVIRQCLVKDPEERWQSAGDLRRELEWIAGGGRTATGGMPATATPRRSRRELLAWILVGALATIAAVTLVPRDVPEPSRGLIRTAIPPPTGVGFSLLGDLAGPPVPSPDGSRIAFGAVGEDGQTRLWIRALDSLESRPVPGTEGAYFPFWSPDGSAVGFFAGASLKRVDLAGGAPLVLVSGISKNAKGGAWGPDGTIVFSPGPLDSLYRVSSSGGSAERLTERDEEIHSTHRWPHFLPDGRQFLYFAAMHQDPRGEAAGVYLGSLDGGEPRFLLRTASEGLQGSGHLLYVEQGILMARPFDPDHGTFLGPPLPTHESVQTDPTTWKAGFGVSESGVLVYGVGGQLAGTELRWFDRRGGSVTAGVSAPNLQGLDLSPDARRVAVDEQTDSPNSDIWVHDLERGTQVRLTFHAADDPTPVWSADGERVFFGSRRDSARYRIYEKAASGAGEASLVVALDGDVRPFDASPDGRFLLFGEGDSRGFTGSRAWVMPLGREPRPLPIDPGAVVSFVQVSPDGGFLAYASDVSGREEIYVTAFHPPAPDQVKDGDDGARWVAGKWQISNGGGSQPRWRGDGREIYYLRDDNTIMAVQLSLRDGVLEVLGESELFRALQRNDAAAYDVAPDGERFLLNTIGATGTRPLVLVLDWPAQLAGRD